MQHKTLRQLAVEAIRASDATPAQKLMLRMRLIGCNRNEAEEFLHDSLSDRKAWPAGTAYFSNALFAEVDWPALIAEMVKIIQDILADKDG